MKNKYPFIDLPKLSNVEAEGGETVRLPDGRTFKLDGDKHKKGGIDLYAPEGTQIFSEHLKLPKDVASKILDTKVTKDTSPAKLSHKFNTNQYLKVMNDTTNRYSKLEKDTAELMFLKFDAMQNNIFHAQEEFKNKGKSKVKSQSTELPKAQAGVQIGAGFGQLNPMFLDQRLQGFTGQPAGPYSNQRRTGTDLYGGVPEFRQEHTDWLKYHYNQPMSGQNFQQAYTDYSQNQFGVVPDFSAGSGNTDYKYGNITREAPLGYSTVRGTKSPGQFTLTDYMNDPKGVADKFGLSPDEIDKAIKTDKSYYVNVPGKEILPVDLPKLDMNNIVGYKPVKDGISLPSLDMTKLGTKDIKDKLDSAYKEDDQFGPGTITEEVPVGIDIQQLINGVEQGLLLTQLATLSKENPYYTNTPGVAPVTRFEPINTKQQERAFHMAKESLDNSNLPEQVKQAQLAYMQGKVIEGVNQIDLANYQGNLQNQNNNTTNITNMINSNNQERTRANYQYMTERARATELYEQQKNNIVTNMLNIWRTQAQNRSDIKLINQLSNNYDFSTRTGDVQYVPGQGVPNFYNNLDTYFPPPVPQTK
jgi:hypothetical protein